MLKLSCVCSKSLQCKKRATCDTWAVFCGLVISVYLICCGRTGLALAEYVDGSSWFRPWGAIRHIFAQNKPCCWRRKKPPSYASVIIFSDIRTLFSYQLMFVCHVPILPNGGIRPSGKFSTLWAEKKRLEQGQKCQQLKKSFWDTHAQSSFTPLCSKMMIYGDFKKITFQQKATSQSKFICFIG